jgi:hypothetical protein
MIDVTEPLAPVSNLPARSHPKRKKATRLISSPELQPPAPPSNSLLRALGDALK